jgi:hypothetical protein
MPPHLRPHRADARLTPASIISSERGHHETSKSDKKRGNCSVGGLIEVLGVQQRNPALERGFKPIDAFQVTPYETDMRQLYLPCLARSLL